MVLTLVGLLPFTAAGSLVPGFRDSTLACLWWIQTLGAGAGPRFSVQW